MSRDHRDLVIETLANSEAELLERVASYRTLLHQTLQALHAATVARDDYQRKYFDARDALRAQGRKEAA